jgi:selenium-binding protein 1
VGREHKVIEIPAEPADPARLPPALKPFKAVPPLITDINLSLDDRFLYVACWGTGDLRCYDVSEPLNPHLKGSVRLGGIASHAAHPKGGELNGGPQMLEVSRAGKRIYFSNSLYSAWDAQFCPEGIRGWVVKVDAVADGGLKLDPHFFIPFEDEQLECAVLLTDSIGHYILQRPNEATSGALKPERSQLGQVPC